MKHLLKIPAHFINNLKLRQKLMLSYFILILIPMTILTLVSYRQASRTVESQVLFSAKQVFEQTHAFLSSKIAKVVNISYIIAVDRNINAILRKEPDTYPLPEQLKDMEDLTASLKSFQGNDDIRRVRLSVNPKFIYACENVNIFSLRENEATPLLRKLTTNNENFLWVPSPRIVSRNIFESPPFISLVRPIYDLNWYQKIIGLLQIDVTENTIRSIIAKATTTQHGVAYLQNSDGTVIISSNDLLKKQFRLSLDYCQKLTYQPDNWAETRYNGKKILVGAKNIDDSDWVLVSIIPFEDILKSSRGIRNQILLLMLALGSMAYVLAYYIAKLTTKRIEILIQTMRKVQNADLNAKIISHSKDEIGELTENFNYMLEKMDALIKKQYQSGQEVKNAELRALQAQINPHFLYNTLDLINWSAIKNNIPEISAIVRSLAKFYKLSLNKGQDVVQLSDEITHAQLYVDIQNQRFQNKIELRLNIEDQLKDYNILKIILQPLVENAILHGIMEKPSKSGTIKISGRLRDGMIILHVQDDGMGMNTKQLKTILTDKTDDRLHGYGIRNIDERIKLFYGNEYGLNYQSRPGIGTTVTVKIPAVKITDKSETGLAL